MEIQINQNNASEFIVETSKIIWKLYARKIIFGILATFLCGLVFLISGLNQEYESSTSDYTYSKDSTVTYVHTIQNNYHIFLGLGIAMVLFSFYLTYAYLVRQKKQYFKEVDTIAVRHKLTSENYSIKITDNSLCYQDFEIKREEKWSVYSKYKNCQDYLFLFRNDFYMSCLAIDKRQISSGDLADLLKKLLGSKLIEKK